MTNYTLLLVRGQQLIQTGITFDWTPPHPTPQTDPPFRSQLTAARWLDAHDEDGHDHDWGDET